MSFTVHYNYSKISRFTPVLCIRAVLNCFYLLISHFENFSTPVPRLLFAIKVMLNLSFVSLMLTFQVLYFKGAVSQSSLKFQPWQPSPNWVKNYSTYEKKVWITQQIQKGERKFKLEEDWNGLKLCSWKLVSTRVFQNSFLLFVTFYKMLGRHIRSTQSCDFAIHKLLLNFCGK